MQIKTLEVAGFASAFEALRLPFNKECRTSYSGCFGATGNRVVYSSDVTVHTLDLKLMQTLVKRGDEHAKSIRGIIAYAEITAPVYWWCEMECYRAGHERLCSESTMHTDCKGLTGGELVKAKSEIPMGKELKKIDYFSYQCLRNIVHQRAEHRLPEWHQFIEWVKSLPLAEELIFTK